MNAVMWQCQSLPISPPIAAMSMTRRPTLHLHPADDPRRARVQAHIAQRYRERYGARLREWLPTLVSLQAGERVLAAAGYRGAQDPLFLERYLSRPVEHYLGAPGAPVARERIVEVGQFAAMRPGAGRLLVPQLAQHLMAQGFEWVVCTITAELHHLFARMELTHRPLAPATPRHLSAAERADWGDYYAHEPQVFAGCLATVVARFPEDA